MELLPGTVPQIAAYCSGVIDDDGFYVYYLCDDQEVLYVGKSTRLMSRMNHHIHGSRKKTFRYLMFRQCESESQMVKLEAREIERLRPPLNKAFPNPPRTPEEVWDGQVRIAAMLNDIIVKNDLLRATDAS